uniref:E3 SUMO-protein ligase NSE2 n=1 Tax=Corethrella appendiculata TaxID=1370023 RepID=U5ES58_9DIPT
MGDLIASNADKIVDSLLQSIKLIAEYEDSKDVKPYTNIVHDICDVELKYGNHKKSLTNAQQCVTLETFDNTYRASTNQNTNPKNCKRFKDFNSNVTNLLNREQQEHLDDSINEQLLQDVALHRIDPFTKRPMRNPVRNSVCKHVYDKDSVKGVLKVNAQTRCPVVGCSSKQYIQMNQLVEDKELRRKLEKVAASEDPLED